eukprot:Em0009g151a
MAMERGPGPARYSLPSCIGSRSHDYRKVQMPAFSMGRRLTTGSTLDQPTLSTQPSRTREKMEPREAFNTPGPGAYVPEQHPNFKDKSPPAYSMGSRTKYRKRDAVPSPNTYTLPTYIGPRVPTRAASACYSMAGRLHLGGFDTDYAKTPGPARYEVLDPSKIGPKSPAYSILSRNYMPGDPTKKARAWSSQPGEMYYNQENVAFVYVGDRSPSPSNTRTNRPVATSVPTLPSITDSAQTTGTKGTPGTTGTKGTPEDSSKCVTDYQEQLLKPIACFANFDAERRELASVISRDIYLHNPDVKWDDIIGLDMVKRLIKEAVVYPIKYPQLFTGILSPWKGLLLYGPPGTGKTLLAKAVATECKTTFFNISASTIVSKWRGDSEKLVRVLFELARFHAPSTIFMDELESIMGQRSGFGSSGGGEHEASHRMKTELLVQMDGLAKSSDLVFVLAASNLPWELDHAMLRRLEKRILVDLPNTAARCAMFKHHLPHILSQSPLTITTEVDYNSVAEMTEGYSGSDVRLVCKEAAMRTVRQVFDKLEGLQETSHLDCLRLDPVTTADVQAAIASTKPSAKLLASRYTQWQKEYESV